MELVWATRKLGPGGPFAWDTSMPRHSEAVTTGATPGLRVSDGAGTTLELLISVAPVILAKHQHDCKVGW
jgi:hypothetical protein